jgi:hypothetical protein
MVRINEYNSKTRFNTVVIIDKFCIRLFVITDIQDGCMVRLLSAIFMAITRHCLTNKGG